MVQQQIMCDQSGAITWHKGKKIAFIEPLKSQCWPKDQFEARETDT